MHENSLSCIFHFIIIQYNNHIPLRPAYQRKPLSRKRLRKFIYPYMITCQTNPCTFR